MELISFEDERTNGANLLGRGSSRSSVESGDASSAGMVEDLPNGKKRLRLKYPVELTLRGKDGERVETIAELVFRRANGGDLKAMGEYKTNDCEASLVLVGRLTGQPTRVVEQLDGEDAAAACVVAGSFFGKPLRTGIL